MRHFLAIAIALQCAHLATAGALPLTGKDVVLMLRMGYSSEDIVRDLSIKHFVGPLDSDSEAQIRQLNGSATLLQGLKDGQFGATKEELTQAEQKSATTNAAVEDQPREQLALQRHGGVGTHSAGSIRHGRAQGHANRQELIDLEVGQRLDLRQFNGPNIQVIVNGIDMSDVLFTLVHPRRMRMVSGGNVADDLSAAPGQTSIRVKKENNSVVCRWGRMKLVYIDAMDTAQNHVKLGIVSE